MKKHERIVSEFEALYNRSDFIQAAEIIDSNPELLKDQRVLGQIATAYKETGNISKAIDVLATGVMKAESGARGGLYALLALCYLQQEAYAAAMISAADAVRYDKASQYVKDVIEYCWGQIYRLYDEGMKDRAYEVTKKVLAYWPDDSRLLAYVGALEIELNGNIALGKQLMDAAFDLENAPLAMLYRQKGIAWYHLLGDKKEGLRCLKKACELNPDKYNLIVYAYRLPEAEIESSYEIYKGLYDKYSSDKDVIYGFADVHIRKGETLKGKALVEEAIIMYPADADFYYLLGLAYFKLDDFIESLKCFNKAEELGYRDIVYVYNAIAECYLELGDHAKAKIFALKSLNINPDDLEAKKFLERAISAT